LFEGSSAYAILHVRPDADWRGIQKAFRTLARKYHPDGTEPDSVRMAQINAAYEELERSHPRGGDGFNGVPVGPGESSTWPAPSAESPRPPAPTLGPLMRRIAEAEYGDTPVIDFGQYAGWRIGEVARYDPAYLRWLSRHSSGIRYRDVIARVLGGDPRVGRRGALLG